jgi:hypothetical protein
MHSLSQKAVVLAMCCAVLATVNGCGSEPSGPLDPALTGNWIIPSVDTYVMFVLQDRGTTVLGTFGLYGALGGGADIDVVSGTADLPHVVLHWVDTGINQTFDATLSDDQQSLTGTLEDGGTEYTFHRYTPPGGRVVAAAH